MPSRSQRRLCKHRLQIRLGLKHKQLLEKMVIKKELINDRATMATWVTPLTLFRCAFTDLAASINYTGRPTQCIRLSLLRLRSFLR
jgi:hypothetical protein